MDQFYIRPITEADLTEIVTNCGGVRAHPDADSRTDIGADYLLGDAVIELKALDDDGLQKKERQLKLASLFLENGFDAPVVVLDRKNLPETAQRNYDRIVEGPIKGAVTSARKQLKQTRKERPEAKRSVLWVINNSYTMLDHDELVRLVTHRVRNDTSSIDGIIVGGCYFHSDGFEHFFIWPLKYVPIKLEAFDALDALHDAWGAFAERFVTSAMFGDWGPKLLKGPVVDSQFDVGGVTFVKPAPPLGVRSDFYRNGRPRKDSTGLAICPPVAMTSPGLSRASWTALRQTLPYEPELHETYEGWLRLQQEARDEADPLKPLVSLPVEHDLWLGWCAKQKLRPTMKAVRAYANSLFQDRVQTVIGSARELKTDSFVPARYILAVTDEIGQDRANDLSHIAAVRQPPEGDAIIRPLVEDLRIFHEHAVALAGAYAVSEGLDAVMWIRHKRYAWA